MKTALIVTGVIVVAGIVAFAWTRRSPADGTPKFTPKDGFGSGGKQPPTVGPHARPGQGGVTVTPNGGR